MSRKMTKCEFDFAKELLGKKKSHKEVALMIGRSDTCVNFIAKAPSFKDYVHHVKAVHSRPAVKPVVNQEGPKAKKEIDYTGALVSEIHRLRNVVVDLTGAMERFTKLLSPIVVVGDKMPDKNVQPLLNGDINLGKSQPKVS